jgi:division protein CdvB (Snf7/Vps24/ESCRT-III family)
MRGVTLKGLLEWAVGRVREQIGRIDAAVQRMEGHERGLFQKALAHLRDGNYAHASLYANECLWARGVIEALLTARFVLERVADRLESVNSVEEFIVEGSLACQLLMEVRRRIGALIPEAACEVYRVAEQLRKHATDVQESCGMRLDVQAMEARM